MSRGIGRTQQVLLDALRVSDLPYMTIAELAEAAGRSDRQVRTAVRSLEQRGEVVVRRGFLHWDGVGERGRLSIHRGERDERPVVLSVEKYDPWPTMPETHHASRDTNFTRPGMPVHGLVVYLVDRWAEQEAAADARFEKVREYLRR